MRNEINTASVEKVRETFKFWRQILRVSGVKVRELRGIGMESTQYQL
jgi:hypothetical protein